jgi:hypothetical protein
MPVAHATNPTMGAKPRNSVRIVTLRIVAEASMDQLADLPDVPRPWPVPRTAYSDGNRGSRASGAVRSPA